MSTRTTSLIDPAARRLSWVSCKVPTTDACFNWFYRFKSCCPIVMSALADSHRRAAPERSPSTGAQGYACRTVPKLRDFQRDLRVLQIGGFSSSALVAVSDFHLLTCRGLVLLVVVSSHAQL
ncbi:hypothetical protein [Pseudomonas glycinae]|uniref:hypothetical protein n=1 Tax=Pseudomonas glycinae TaxID=1785145 RepID=UPI00167E8BBE|nr:hypothetical protein [Pseudomonas glycinae]